MSNDFNWQTEDEMRWGEEISPVPETAVSQRHPWLFGLILVGLLAIAGGVVYQQITRRIESATSRLEIDILASHTLLNYANQQGDLSLFTSILSGKDAAWSATYDALIDEGLLLDRNWMGWQLPPDPIRLTSLDLQTAGREANNIRDIELNPDLTAAEVMYGQDYVLDVGNGLTQTITLEQTAVYRLGSRTWLFSPPEREFWGRWVTNEGAQVTLIYPQRDAEIGDKLAFDLDRKLNEACQSIRGLQCPADFRVYVRLDSDPATLLDVADPGWLYQNDLQLDLPAPSLIGRPIDEAGYQALYRGYAAQMITAVITHFSEYDCCQYSAYFQALTHYQLYQLGMQPWPISVADYQRFLIEEPSISHFNEVWFAESFDYLFTEEGWSIYLLIDFMVQQDGAVPPFVMQQQLASDQTFLSWVGATGIIQYDAALNLRNQQGEAFEEMLWLFADGLVSQVQPTPPIALPRQNLHLLCEDKGNPDFSKLYQYDFSTANWTETSDSQGVTYIAPFADDSGLIWQEVNWQDVSAVDVLDWKTVWFEVSGEIREIPWATQNGDISLGQLDPTGRFLMSYNIVDDTSQKITQVLNQAVDVANCHEADCVVYDLPGAVRWSPNGQHTLVSEETQFFFDFLSLADRSFMFGGYEQYTAYPISLGDELGQNRRLVGQGMVPFWVDADRYGFVQLPPDSAVFLGDVNGDDAQIVLSKTELLPYMPEDIVVREPLLFIRYVLMNPIVADTLILGVFDQGLSIFHIISYNLNTRDINYLFPIQTTGSYSIGFSPDGRWLLVTAAVTDREARPFPEGQTRLFLYDTQADELHDYLIDRSPMDPGLQYDWSLDGQWLAVILNDRLLNIMAPAYDYQQLLPHPEGACTSVVWLNQ